MTVPLLPAWLRWTAVGLLAAVIFVLSVVFAPPDQVAPKPDPIALDKWRHFLAYAALGGAVAYGFADHRWRTATAAVVGVGATVCYGVGIEATQALLPNRYFSLGDAVANAVGALLASPTFVLFRRAPKRAVLCRWRTPPWTE